MIVTNVDHDPVDTNIIRDVDIASCIELIPGEVNHWRLNFDIEPTLTMVASRLFLEVYGSENLCTGGVSSLQVLLHRTDDATAVSACQGTKHHMCQSLGYHEERCTYECDCDTNCESVSLVLMPKPDEDNDYDICEVTIVNLE